jgi:hypothetical protein
VRVVSPEEVPSAGVASLELEVALEVVPAVPVLALEAPSLPQLVNRARIMHADRMVARIFFIFKFTPYLNVKGMRAALFQLPLRTDCEAQPDKAQCILNNFPRRIRSNFVTHFSQVYLETATL